jgi:hypothetical protein
MAVQARVAAQETQDQAADLRDRETLDQTAAAEQVFFDDPLFALMAAAEVFDSADDMSRWVADFPA